MLYVPRDGFPPTRVDVRVLFAEELARRGHRIDWLLSSATPHSGEQQIEYGGGTAWVAPARPGTSASAKLIRACQALLKDLKLFRLLRAHRYDFLIVRDRFFGALIPLLAARLTGTPFIYWLSYPYPEAWIYESRSGIGNHPRFARLHGHLGRLILYRLVLPAARFAFVQSRQMLEDIAGEGIAREKLEPVPMGIGDMFLEPVPFRPHDERPVVLYIGTLNPVRRLDFVLRAFARVLTAYPSALLALVGGEPREIEKLQRLARQLRISDSVSFTGTVGQTEIIKWIRVARVCLSPFFPTPILNSTSPTKLIEYLSQGSPVVANQHPEQSRVLAESGGGLCVPWDEERFAEAICEILQAPERAAEMGRRGREYVIRERSYAVIAGRVENRLQALRNRGPKNSIEHLP